MRSTRLMISLFLASSLFTACAIAADTTSATAQTAGKLEKISDNPVAATTPGMKECEHKNGEPCPYHHDDKHHGMSHEKCDYKHPG